MREVGCSTPLYKGLLLTFSSVYERLEMWEWYACCVVRVRFIKAKGDSGTCEMLSRPFPLFLLLLTLPLSLQIYSLQMV
jgi:hypothetical protein